MGYIDISKTMIFDEILRGALKEWVNESQLYFMYSTMKISEVTKKLISVFSN